MGLFHNLHHLLTLQGLMLSKQAPLLSTPNPRAFRDMSNDTATLQMAGISHGDMVFMLYG